MRKRAGGPRLAVFETWDAECRLCNLTLDFLHHKSSVCAITDFQPTARDNDDRIEKSRRVPASEDGHRIRHNPIVGRSLTTSAAKSPLSHLFSKTLSVSPLESKTDQEFFP
jgi:hypothetical protein